MMLLRTDNRTGPAIPSSEITPRATFEAFKTTRRRVLSGMGAMGAAAVTAGFPRFAFADKLTAVHTDYAVPDRDTTPEVKAQSYNNFYEFGEDKSDPAHNAHTLRTRPWTVKIEGLVKQPQTIDIDKLIGYRPLEQRVYRFRCVEAWSMVIPWVGFPLASLIKDAQPNANAKYVAFQTLYDPSQMPGQKDHILDWPYREGLRMDEAMHPLTLLAVGLYGQTLPNQDGAPIRLVVPWKYGFKGVKSIVRISFVRTQTKTTWSTMAPDEYGFYANVNPEVDHPRWSQATERRIGEFFRRKTLPFNGYGDQVASLYRGLDPRKLY